MALTTLASGLVLALGTPWGPARHRRVRTTFGLTLAATTATAFALRPDVHAALAAVTAGAPLPGTVDVPAGPFVSLAAYGFMTVISLLKPWGPTRRGGRPRRPSRRGEAAAPAARAR
ncbi:hypothetical protein [Streptomyces sp. AD55]|uniref:hypothetical protein n=1 Tax=Streptomyces sp. AD55 TaxID=3242895 RepID=UPI003528BE4A